MICLEMFTSRLKLLIFATSIVTFTQNGFLSADVLNHFSLGTQAKNHQTSAPSNNKHFASPSNRMILKDRQESENRASQESVIVKQEPKRESAVFAAGCFWCVEAVYLRLDGVKSVESGYTGGTIVNPNYQMVMTGQTGHAEAIRVSFNPDVISYQDLLEVLFEVHNPTTLNRQGNDIGTQYRSAIFYVDEQQRETAVNFINQMTEEKKFKRPIVTQVVAASDFYLAEAYHQNYYAKNPRNPYCQSTIPAKLRKLNSKFKDKLKDK